MFADVDVRDPLGPPAEVGVMGEFSAECWSCSFVFFFFRNPRVGMRASVTRRRRENDRGATWKQVADIKEGSWERNVGSQVA